MPAYQESLFRIAGEMGLDAERRILPLGTFPPKDLYELAAGASVAIGLNDQSDINCRTNGGASNNTGQCQRYHEYEIRPMAPIGDHAKRCPHPRVGWRQPAPITSAVPSTGSRAAVPG